MLYCFNVIVPSLAPFTERSPKYTLQIYIFVLHFSKEYLWVLWALLSGKIVELLAFARYSARIPAWERLPCPRFSFIFFSPSHHLTTIRLYRYVPMLNIWVQRSEDAWEDGSSTSQLLTAPPPPSPKKELLQAGWTPEPVSMLWREGNFLASSGNRTSAVQPLIRGYTKLTKLSCLNRALFLCSFLTTWPRICYLKLKSVALVRERTIPTKLRPLVGEVSAKFLLIEVSRGQRNGSLRPYSRISRSYLFIYVFNNAE
jgi:hypothetical protein